VLEQRASIIKPTSLNEFVLYAITVSNRRQYALSPNTQVVVAGEGPAGVASLLQV